MTLPTQATRHPEPYNASVFDAPRRHTRLVQFNGFDRPTDELSDYDALRLGTEVQDEERDEIPDPAGRDGEKSGPVHTDEWVGRFVRLYHEGKTLQEIGDELGLSAGGAEHFIAGLRRRIAPRSFGGGKGVKRARAVTPEQEEQILAMDAEGKGVDEIAHEIGSSIGVVRHVIRYEEEQARRKGC